MPKSSGAQQFVPNSPYSDDLPSQVFASASLDSPLKEAFVQIVIPRAKYLSQPSLLFHPYFVLPPCFFSVHASLSLLVSHLPFFLFSPSRSIALPFLLLSRWPLLPSSLRSSRAAPPRPQNGLVMSPQGKSIQGHPQIPRPEAQVIIERIKSSKQNVPLLANRNMWLSSARALWRAHQLCPDVCCNNVSNISLPSLFFPPSSIFFSLSPSIFITRLAPLTSSFNSPFSPSTSRACYKQILPLRKPLWPAHPHHTQQQ